MSAPNLPALLDFEGQFEAAAQAILTANGITAYISQQESKELLISTGIGFDTGPALDEKVLLDPAGGYPALPSNWTAGQPPPQEYFRYTGSLEYRIEVPRDQEGASLPGVANLMGELRGKIRAAMMLCCAPFNATNLPYLRVSDIRPNGTTTGWERERNIDYLSLRFTITFAIVPGAWPAWIEA